MKKIYAIILFAMICASQIAVAQNSIPISSSVNRSTVWLLDSVKTWQFDITTKAFDKPLYAQYYSYDANNNEINFVEEAYNSGAWTNSFQDSFYYNNQNQATSQLYQTWSSGAWQNSQLIYNLYNGSGEKDSTYTDDWAASTWVLSSASSSTFDANKNLISTLGWAYDNPTWLYSSLDSFTYNGNNQQTSGLQLTWSGSVWDNSALYTYMYDGNGNDTGELVQSWNVNSWTNVASFSNTFDVNNNEDYAIRISLNGATANDSNQYYYHQAVSAAVTEVANSPATISTYPNPAGSFVNIAFTDALNSPQTITLYDVTGRALLAQPVNSNPMRLSTGNLAAGVYEVVATDDEGNRMVREVVIDK